MVQVREKMTADPVICESTDTIATVAKLMRDQDSALADISAAAGND